MNKKGTLGRGTDLAPLEIESVEPESVEPNEEIAMTRVARCPIYVADPQAIEYPDPTAPVIVLAVPRSGSQLLRSILNCHPDLYIAQHSELLWKLFDGDIDLVDAKLRARYERRKDRSNRTFEQYLDWARRAMMNFWLSCDEPARLGKSAAYRWGFKVYNIDPCTAESFKLLFPNATYIHIVRDGRNVVASWMYNFDWLVKPHLGVEPLVESIGEMWARSVEAADTITDHRIQLEGLRDPHTRAASATSLFDALGLSVHPRVEAFLRSLPKVDPTSDREERWQHDLAVPQARRLCQTPAFAEQMGRLGYELEWRKGWRCDGRAFRPSACPVPAPVSMSDVLGN